MVLDPLTALSLAGNVVQFVDFGTKILTKSLLLIRRDRDEPDVVTELEKAVTYLKDLCVKLSQPFLSDVLSSSEAAEREPLEQLCGASIALAGQLLNRLDKVKVEGKHRKWKCFREAVKWAWNEDELEHLVQRLSSLRQIVEMHVLVGLRYVHPLTLILDQLLIEAITTRERLDIFSLMSSERFDRLDFETQNILTALVGTYEIFSSKLKDHTQKIQDGLSAELRVQTKAISQMMSRLEPIFAVPEERYKGWTNEHETSRGILGSRPRSCESRDSLENQLDNLWEEEFQTRRRVERAILDDFRFPSMTNRKEEIADTHPETFQWIFRESPRQDDEPSWSNFAHWLQHRSSIYWINGKAASGKSTLMRYIYEDPRTLTFLTRWANPEEPTVADFYFWNSGTLEQRSQAGLLRTILFHLLNCHPQLISILLPVEYARGYAEVATPTGDISSFVIREPWTLKNLMSLFRQLLEQREIPIKLCLFIDGLDEYEGCYDEIVDLFRSTTSRNVKVCLSSRPLLPFQDSFGEGDSLRLQDLTYSDIQNYVSSELSKHRRYCQLLCDEPIRAPQLVEEIVSKANGVFLWVKLVVQSLRTGLGNCDSVKDLQRRLHLLPGDLEQLYSHMLAHIDDIYKTQASEYFQLVHTARLQFITTRNDDDNTEPLTLIELSLADDEDPELAITAPMKSLSRARIKARCELTQARLHVRCLGLLEVHLSRDAPYQVIDFNRIQYLHRTTRDYLERPDVWSGIVAQTAGTDFDPNLSLLRACVLQIKWDLHKAVSPQYVFRIATSYARKIERSTGQGHVELIDQLFLAIQAKTYANQHASFQSLASENNLRAYLKEKKK